MDFKITGYKHRNGGRPGGLGWQSCGGGGRVGGCGGVCVCRHLEPYTERNHITREKSLVTPRNTPPKIAHLTQPSNCTECPQRGQRRNGRMYVWYRHLYRGRHWYDHNERNLCLCAYDYVCPIHVVHTCTCSCRHTHTHTHTHTHRGMGLNHQKGMKSHSLQELGETFRGYYAK